MSGTGAWRGLIERYRALLPIAPQARVISLCEGMTPLVELQNLPRTLPVPVSIWVKFEGLNPTGSFKDRGMTVAVTQAVSEGARAIICASTGNTSASAAAYAARAGIAAFVLIPEGKIALGKLAQAIVHGATVVQIRGNFDAGMQLVKEVAATAPVTIVNSINPFRLQGQKTAAFEIAEALAGPPTHHCLPVGNAGNITAHWIGYSELAGCATGACRHCAGQCHFAAEAVRGAGARPGVRPVMVGYQASGAAPFLRGYPIDDPETVATAIRIGRPQSWDEARAVVDEARGWFDQVDDAEILATQRLLAAREGIFCEPASATALAGALRDIKSGRIPPGSRVVCTLTGHGLKDPDTALKLGTTSVVEVEARLDAVRATILERLA